MPDRGDNTQVNSGEAVLKRYGYVERIGQEHSELTNRHDLKRETQPVVVPAPARDQLPVFVIEVEEPLQLNTGQRPEPAVAALIGHHDMKSPTAQHRSMFRT